MYNDDLIIIKPNNFVVAVCLQDKTKISIVDVSAGPISDDDDYDRGNRLTFLTVSQANVYTGHFKQSLHQRRGMLL